MIRKNPELTHKAIAELLAVSSVTIKRTLTKSIKLYIKYFQRDQNQSIFDCARTSDVDKYVKGSYSGGAARIANGLNKRTINSSYILGYATPNY